MLWSAVLCTPWTVHSADKPGEVRIAVLFTEDPLFFINTFAPTLDHLRKALPQYKIVTKEISGHESPEDIRKEHFSFLISSAGFYASFDPSSAGLAIEKLWVEETKFLVVRLDFSELKFFSSPEEFSRKFASLISRCFGTVGFQYVDDDLNSAAGQLSNLS